MSVPIPSGRWGNRNHLPGFMRTKRILVKIIAGAFDSDAVRAENHSFIAQPHMMYNDKSKDEIADYVADYLEKRYPTLDFRMVEVGERQLNFVPVGERLHDADVSEHLLMPRDHF